MNTNRILLEAALDVGKSRRNIESDLRTIKQQLRPLMLNASLNNASVGHIVTQLNQISGEPLDVTINTADLQNQARLAGEAMHRELSEALQQIQTDLQASSQITISAEAPEQSESGLFDQLFDAQKILEKSTAAFTEMCQHVLELDNQLLELSKVSDLSERGLKAITVQAFELGTTVGKAGSEVLAAVTDFKKIGYDLSESMSLAKEALKMSNLSTDIDDAGTAAESLIQIMNGFEKDAGFAEKINDAISAISDNQDISFDHLAEGAQQLSETAHQAGLSFEQMLGTLTGTYQVLGDMEQTVAGQTSIFSRLQGIQLEGEQTVKSTSELQKEFLRATAGTVSLINQQTGELRNVYDILTDLSKVWNSLDTGTQERIAIDISGAGQEDVFLAMMNNWNSVQTAAITAADSFGAADAANQQYINSLSGKLEEFRNQFEQLSQTIASSDLLKFFVDLGTSGVGALNQLTQTVGTLPVLLGGLGAGRLLDRKSVV